jgi:AraC-like DNA-binding protein
LDIGARLATLTPTMLHSRTLLQQDGLTVADVACRHRAGRGDAGEHASGWALILVRRGCFVRVADGAGAVLDPTMAYTLRPGEEQRYDHPHDGGDDCTAIWLGEDLMAGLRCDDDGLPAGMLRIGAAADLEHRLLVAALRRGDDAGEAWERALAVCGAVLSDGDDGGAPGPAPSPAWRALAASAREALAADPRLALPELARELGVSPHHLSRVFRAVTGTTVARHRMRLRARAALERLAGGETDLAGLAYATGFADQSHLTRVLKRETGTTPAALRAALG